MRRPPSDAGPPIPAEAEDTPRTRLGALLRGPPATTRELSQQSGLSEKDVLHHLEHLARSARARGEKLVITPATCLACHFTFEDRDRLTRPGTCPRCRATRITHPRFSISP